TVGAGAATQVTLTTQPSATAQSGVAFAQQPVVQLRDGAGNPVSQSGVTVTAAIATGAGTLGGTLTATTTSGGTASFTNLSISGTAGDRTLSFSATGGGTLGGTVTAATNGSGVASFTNLSISGTAGERTLTFSAAGFVSAASGPVNVTAGAATQLTLTTQPSSTAQSGVPFAQQPVVQLRDGAGNAVSQAGVTVTAAIATGGGTLGGTLTATTNGSGIASFTDLTISGAAGDRTLSFSA